MRKDRNLEFLGAIGTLYPNFDFAVSMLTNLYNEKLASAKFQVGDRVSLKKVYDSTSPSFAVLKKSEEGTVEEVDLSKDLKMSYIVRFDSQKNTSHHISDESRLTKVK